MKAIGQIRRACAPLAPALLALTVTLIALRPAQPVAAANAPPPTTADLVAYAQQVARANGIDPAIFVRQIVEESGFNPNAYNARSGATGIAQIVPGGQVGIDPRDPWASLAYAARLDASYLSQLGRDDLMLAAYNAGPAVVTRCRCVPPYPQTQAYVRDILGGSSASPTSSSSAAADPPVTSPVTLAGRGTPVDRHPPARLRRSPTGPGPRS